MTTQIPTMNQTSITMEWRTHKPIVSHKGTEDALSTATRPFYEWNVEIENDVSESFRRFPMTQTSVSSFGKIKTLPYK